MAGLIAFGIVGLYLAVSIVIIRVLARRTSSQWVRWTIYGLGLPLLIAAPLADEIIGKFQFDKLCKEAEDIQIYGSIPVGEELYTPEGKWRLGIRPLSLEERNRADEAYRAVVRTESIGPKEIEAAIPIQMYEHHFYNKIAGERLASYQQYGSRGGWISRNLEKPILVRDQCSPPSAGLELKYKLLPFKKKISGGEK